MMYIIHVKILGITQNTLEATIGMTNTQEVSNIPDLANIIRVMNLGITQNTSEATIGMTNTRGMSVTPARISILLVAQNGIAQKRLPIEEGLEHIMMTNEEVEMMTSMTNVNMVITQMEAAILSKTQRI